MRDHQLEIEEVEAGIAAAWLAWRATASEEAQVALDAALEAGMRASIDRDGLHVDLWPPGISPGDPALGEWCLPAYGERVLLNIFLPAGSFAAFATSDAWREAMRAEAARGAAP